MAAQQNVWYFLTIPFRWSGVQWVFQQIVFKAFLNGAGGIAHHPWQQPNNGVDHWNGSDFASTEHKITQADLSWLPFIQHALIDTFIAATQYAEARSAGQFFGQCLAKGFTPRAKVDQRSRCISAEGQALINHIRSEHHAGTAAKRRVIYGSMTICCHIADIVNLQCPSALL